MSTTYDYYIYKQLELDSKPYPQGGMIGGPQLRLSSDSKEGMQYTEAERDRLNDENIKYLESKGLI